MKIRIFALAKELGIDSKVLIDHCSDAGIHVKNSALASISPEERDILIKHLESVGSSPASSSPSEPPPPSREPVRAVGGKIRKLEKPVRAEPELAEDESVAEEVEPSVEAANPVEVAEPVAEEVETAAAVETPAVQDETAEPDVEAEPAPAKTNEPPADKADYVTREEYVSASGSGMAGGSKMREMKPIGTVQDVESRRRRAAREKKKGETALPAIAAPPELPTVHQKPVKPEEPAAQKPVIPLGSDLFEKQSPLGDRVRGKEQRDDQEARPARGGGKRRMGSLIEQRRRERDMQQQVQQPPQRRRITGRKSRRRGGGPVELKSEATIEAPITVRSLSEAIGRPAKGLLQILFKQGRMCTINESLEEDEALQLAMELGVDLEVKRGRDVEQELLETLEAEHPSETLTDRPPIVTILGHVDHGKTSLLDRIRQADVVSGEAGGITQHIAAYQVRHNDKPITFVDTPGHAAFSEMRSRGANVTDIIVLVVAADDGVMPQTEECISHAKAAGVPLLVAMNKIDLPDIDDQRVLQQLAQHEILPAEWGGDTEVVRTSAATGDGIEDLLETILLTAELHEYKANTDRPAVGVCLEAFRDEGRGVLAWVIVTQGILRLGDVILCGPTFGRVRALYNDRDEELTEALPGQPVRVAGLDAVPGAGDHFFCMEDVEEAREVAEARAHRGRTEVLASRSKPRTMEDILTAAREGEVGELPLILKADTQGSIEALKGEIEKFEHPEVRVDIVHSAVGGVNESDVTLASAAGAIIVAFHVVAEDRAQMLAEQEGVEIRRYDIIYEVTQHIRLALEGLLRPDVVRVATGRALVLQTFHITRFGTIAGCRVLSGKIERSNKVQVIRDQKVLNDYGIASLKREKDDVKEVREGMECGIRLDGFNDIKEGDLLEAFRVDEIQRKLEDVK